MGTQQFCLKWNNHHSNMLVVFEQLLSSEALVDVTLACEGLSLKAHKMVLSACSPFFQSLFLENPCKHPIVILKDMRYTDLKAIIDFMYRGEVNVSQDQLSALLKTAETLKVKGLAEVTGDNRQGNGSGIVQQEIVQHNSTPQSSVPASGATTQHRAESPPLSRRKRGRPRRRSLSDSNRSDSEDQIPSKIKEPDSPEIIEDVNNDLTSDGVDVRQRLVSVPPLNQQSQVSSPNVPHLPPIASHKPHPALPSIHTQDARNVNMDENPSGDEADFEVDASKLMEQTMTTENVPVFADVQASGSSILPVSTQVALTSSTSGIVDTRPLQIAQVPASDSQALVPAPDQSVVLTSQDTTQDIKPMVSFEEPPISPVAGPSHGQDNSSSSLMMYMDTSGVPAIAGPSNYQPEKQTSSQQQSTQVWRHARRFGQNSYDAMSNLEHDDINSILFETQNLAHNERVNNSNLVELFPGTDVWVNAQQKTTAILKANGKPSKLVALSLRMLHSTEELANFSLEGQRAKIAYPENEAYAIKVFVLSICQKDRGKPAISNTEFNKLFNRVFAMARSVILPEEEKQRRRMKSLTYMRKKRAKARK